ARAERLLYLLGFYQVVHLVKVEVIRLEQLQRRFELLARALAIALLGLAGEEILTAVETLKPDAHLGFALAVAVGGRDIVIIQPAFERAVNRGGAFLLVVVDEREAGKCNHRHLLARATQNPLGQACDFFHRLGSIENSRNTQGGGPGCASNGFEEYASFHILEKR